MYAMNDFFDDAVRLRDVVDTFFRDIPTRGNRVYDYPYINLHEEGDTLELKAVMPGVSKDDISIELTDSGLLLQGERKSDVADRPYLRRERTFGTFKKTIRLPFPVKQDAINANLKNGILSVTLEKSDDAKPRKIEIK